MGLDMYLYAIRKGDPHEWGVLEKDQRIELGYWRKHHDLHGLLEEIWEEKGKPLPAGRSADDTSFNCVPVKLTPDEIKSIMKAVKNDTLPETSGFFFGNYPPDKESIKRDLKIFKEALSLAKAGLDVYYDSWW